MSTTKNNYKLKHNYYMKLAFDQARKIMGNTGENPAVGCVLVKDNVLINLSHTNFKGRPHAEQTILSKQKINFKNSRLYTTLEPCSHRGKTPPCVDIISKKKIKSVYFSKIDPDVRSFNKAKKKLKKFNIKTFNILKNLGKSFYKDFDIKNRTNSIFITSKLATSKDMFIVNKKNKWITNNYSRYRVHYLRSTHDSILTTSKTVIKDNPTLNCRINGLEKYSPIRLILDKNLKIPVTKKIIKSAHKVKTYLFYNKEKINKLIELNKYNVKTVKISLKNGHLNFEEIIIYFRKIKIYRIFVEAGVKFNNFLLLNNYVNDFYHFKSNNLLKNNGFCDAEKILKKINKIKKNKKKLQINLFTDQLNKYSLK